MAKKKGKGFGDLTKKVLTDKADKPDNAPTSLADFQDDEDVKTSERQDVVASKRQNAKASSSQDVKTSKRQSVKTPKKTPKPQEDEAAKQSVRATVYFSEDAADSLDEVWLRLRKAAKKAGRKQISKSQIIEEALLIALEELEKKGEKSKLFKALKL